MELLKKDGQPERLLKQHEPFEQIMTASINQYCRGNLYPVSGRRSGTYASCNR